MEANVINISRELRAAFESGLRQQYGEPLGSLLADAVGYGPHGRLDPVKVRKSLDDESAVIVAALVNNRSDAPLMMMLRNQMIGHALLRDRDGVIRWATEGQNRVQRVGGPWLATLPQWQWVLGNTDRYILAACQLKAFLNQL